MDAKAAIATLDAQLRQLKVAYEQYFLGMEPREPLPLRQQVERAFRELTTGRIQNTADRYKLKSLQQRFQTFRRQWDETLRKIEAGTYRRHLFKANLREKARSDRQAAQNAEATKGSSERRKPGRPAKGSLYDDYVRALRDCGQEIAGVTPAKLDAAMKKQEAALRARHGASSVRFRVAVEAGKVRLKASVKK